MPRHKTIAVSVYSYDELPTEEAKEKARDWFRKCIQHDEWWDGVYEDAKRIGLKITEFDLGGGCTIDGDLEVTTMECCKRILKEHGEDCDTYKLAERTFDTLRNLEEELEICEGDDEATESAIVEEQEDVKAEFTRALLEEYWSILRHEYEWYYSQERIEEDIRINECEFLKNGEKRAWV